MKRIMCRLLTLFFRRATRPKVISFPRSSRFPASGKVVSDRKRTRMKKTLLLICLVAGFASAQSNRTVLLMGADDDTIVRAFAEENACANLHEVRPENGSAFRLGNRGGRPQ